MRRAETLYKFLQEDGSPTHGPNSFRWPLPENGEPGDWVSVKGPLIPCENGLHLVRASGLLEWANAQLYEAEYDVEAIEKDEHVLVCRKARLLRGVKTWNEKNLRLFACDCAERVLPVYEAAYPGDVRPRWCIETVRAFALGKATEQETRAARDAARDAAWAATAAARDAAWAAWDAAWDAARAAWAAARDAARDAGAAAWAAATAAWAAARAARDAAAAAWAAARDAERVWQTERLHEYLYGSEAE